MAKRDFIVKQKSFIEKENRTTIAGIVAIVAVVLIVATFMKVQEIGFFADADENLAGLASETFVGTRHIELTGYDALVSRVQIPRLGERVYYAYPEAGILTIAFPGSYRQAVLSPEKSETPTLYRAIYADAQAVNSQQTREPDVTVVVNTRAKHMIVSGLSIVDLELAASEMVIYDGSISVAGRDYYFKLFGNQLEVEYDTRLDVVLLEEDAGVMTGTWDGRSVTVNARNNLLIIQDFY